MPGKELASACVACPMVTVLGGVDIVTTAASARRLIPSRSASSKPTICQTPLLSTSFIDTLR